MTFELSDYTRSETATRLGIDNTPSQEVIDNLKLWHAKIREPLEYKLGTGLFILSGYRSLRLNRTLGSSDKSQHILGLAGDFIVNGYTATDLYRWILDKTELPFDQLILEYPKSKSGGWVHCSYSKTPRKQSFVIE